MALMVRKHNNRIIDVKLIKTPFLKQMVRKLVTIGEINGLTADNWFKT